MIKIEFTKIPGKGMLINYLVDKKNKFKIHCSHCKKKMKIGDLYYMCSGCSRGFCFDCVASNKINCWKGHLILDKVQTQYICGTLRLNNGETKNNTFPK